MLTLPVAIPANLASVMYLQLLMAASLFHLGRVVATPGALKFLAIAR